MKRSICLLSMSALGVVLTFTASLIRIPVPSVRWFFHLGDAVIFIMALLFGPVAGCIAGALGSSWADVQMGLTVWVPMTLVIKGVEGLVVGWIGQDQNGSWEVPSLIAGSVVMIAGYAVASVFLFGWPALIWEVPVDLVQCSVAMILSLFLVRNIRKRFPNIPKLKECAEWKKSI